MESNSPPTSGGVRRHHTITAASRSARASALSEEEQQQQSWNEDEVVDQGWVGGVGAVGEKSGLHRQASLPTKYNRAFHGAGKSGTMTPGMNSLSAIAGHEGDEEDWERDISTYGQGSESGGDQAGGPSPLSPHASHVPSPPPAESGVRRHQSLTYGAHGHGPRHQLSSAGLKRSGTLQAQSKHSVTPQPPSPTNAEEDYPYPDEEPYEEDAYYSAAASPRSQQPPGNAPFSNSPMRRSSPWGQGNDWRSSSKQPGAPGTGNAAIDDVQRALSALELDSGGSQPYIYGTSDSHPPPRFNSGQQSYVQSGGNLQLVTDGDERRSTHGGSQSPFPQQSQHQRSHTHNPGMMDRDERSQNMSGPGWEQRERMLGGRYSNPNMNYGYQQGQVNVPNVPPIPAQYLSQQPGNNQAPRLGSSNSESGQNPNSLSSQGSLGVTPVDVPSLIALKGYNPQNFDLRPQFARYFVIKSYTEDDVHKSLKYEIWSSTDPGNKRLDKAFKETTGRGPIYLFFSVNASGHFCGMAEMLTPVDYTRSSTVWASDKWKGVFKVRWIFVRDIPNANLRHIKLNNTQERKPVTNSRDTQELLPDAGQEMLRIFHTHPARTSLLQDFAFYELQSLQKMQAQQSASPPLRATPTSSPPPQSMSPVNNAQPGNFAMANPNALAYTVPQMTPLMQMQLHMNLNSMNPQYNMPSNQAMHQSVMRDHNPAQGNGQSNYNGSQGF